MGLDGIELVLACEEEFGIHIPDSVAMQCRTPKHLSDYIYSRVQKFHEQQCLSQIGFYKIRRSLIQNFGGRKQDIRPSSELTPYLANDTRNSWHILQKSLGCERFPQLTVNTTTARIIYGGLPVIVIGLLVSAVDSILRMTEIVLLFQTNPILIKFTSVLFGLMFYLIIITHLTTRWGQTLPKQLTQVKDLIPFVTCSKSTRWSAESVLETVLDLTARHAEIRRDQFNENSDFTQDIGLD